MVGLPRWTKIMAAFPWSMHDHGKLSMACDRPWNGWHVKIFQNVSDSEVFLNLRRTYSRPYGACLPKEPHCKKNPFGTFFSKKCPTVSCFFLWSYKGRSVSHKLAWPLNNFKVNYMAIQCFSCFSCFCIMAFYEILVLGLWHRMELSILHYIFQLHVFPEPKTFLISRLHAVIQGFWFLLSPIYQHFSFFLLLPYVQYCSKGSGF